MLRLVMATPDPEAAPPRVLGVDDFAIRRGQHYGTLLIDIETGAPLDLLQGRDAQPLADWLTAGCVNLIWPHLLRRIPAIVATLASDGPDGIGFNGSRCGPGR